LTTDQAEPFVERQARAFELGKPYLVARWTDDKTEEPASGRAGDGRALVHSESRSERSTAGTSG
jgi:hypothetical protein